MGNKIVVGQLVKHLASILCKIRTLENEAGDLRVIADALGMSIKTFDPTYRVNAIKSVRTNNPRSIYFKNREGTRSVLDVMQDSGKLLTIEDIARECEQFAQEPITRSNRLKQIASVRPLFISCKRVGSLKRFRWMAGCKGGGCVKLRVLLGKIEIRHNIT